MKDQLAGSKVAQQFVGHPSAGVVPEVLTNIATVAAGYADGILRAISSKGASLYAGDAPCPIVGRVSMDLITVDITHLPEVPRSLDILGPQQGVDALAEAGGTIGYEILTGLGARYQRRYQEGAA